MRMSTSETPDREPDIVMVEAPTAQKALEQVSARFGSRAQIVGASKVLRGGIGGFFAREMIQLRVRVDTQAGHGGQEPAGAGTTAAGPSERSIAESSSRPPVSEASPAVGRLLSALTGSENDRERTFADKLRAQLAERGVAAHRATDPSGPVGAAGARSAGTAAAARAAAAAVEVDDLRRRMGGSSLAVMHGLGPAGSQPGPTGTAAGDEPRGASVLVTPPTPAEQPRAVAVADVPVADVPVAEVPVAEVPVAVPDAVWDPDKMCDLGLPEVLCDAVSRAGGGLPALQAVASAVAMLCRPLPSGTQMLVGPRAGVLSPTLGLPLVLPPGPTPQHGPVAAKVGRTHRAWIDVQRRDRWVHLVAGGRGWEALADVDALAVSWTSPDELPAVLRLAVGRGLVLGYDGSRSARRATPDDVAIALRELLVTR